MQGGVLLQPLLSPPVSSRNFLRERHPAIAAQAISACRLQRSATASRGLLAPHVLLLPSKPLFQTCRNGDQSTTAHLILKSALQAASCRFRGSGRALQNRNRRLQHTCWPGQQTQATALQRPLPPKRCIFHLYLIGSCGYTDYPTISLPFSRMVAASADADPTYAGSCGTCWEVRCKPGTVISESTYIFPLISACPARA